MKAAKLGMFFALTSAVLLLVSHQKAQATVEFSYETLFDNSEADDMYFYNIVLNGSLVTFSANHSYNILFGHDIGLNQTSELLSGAMIYQWTVDFYQHYLMLAREIEHSTQQMPPEILRVDYHQQDYEIVINQFEYDSYRRLDIAYPYMVLLKDYRHTEQWGTEYLTSIELYNLNTDEVMTVEALERDGYTSGEMIHDVRINQNWVVWNKCNDWNCTEYNEIWVYNLLTGNSFQITTQEPPQNVLTALNISPSDIVLYGFSQNVSPRQTILQAYDLNSDLQWQVFESSNIISAIEVSNDYVVWEAFEEGANSSYEHVYLHDLISGETQAVSNQPGRQYLQDISGDRIAYVDNSLGYYRVVLAEFESQHHYCEDIDLPVEDIHGIDNFPLFGSSGYVTEFEYINQDQQLVSGGQHRYVDNHHKVIATIEFDEEIPQAKLSLLAGFCDTATAPGVQLVLNGQEISLSNTEAGWITLTTDEYITFPAGENIIEIAGLDFGSLEAGQQINLLSGSLKILAPADCDRVDASKLDICNNPESTTLFEEQFTREARWLYGISREFNADNQRAVLCIQNGDEEGNNRAKQVNIWLNGYNVVDGSAFNVNIENVERYLQLSDGSNNLEIELGDIPDTTITIQVKVAPESTPDSDSCVVDNDQDGFISSLYGGLDCDDENSEINPNALDVCDGIDNDCSLTPDGSAESWFEQACDGNDSDQCLEGIFVCQQGNQVCTDDSLDNQELCNDIDDNCDGNIDEGFNVGLPCSSGLGACQAHGQYQCSVDGLETQCDATPGQPTPEICDTIDNDCNGLADDVDNDFDSYYACDIWVSQGFWDCDDSSAAISPQGQEQCDGLDNDCNGFIDDKDADLDGYIDAACGGEDPDDSNPFIPDGPADDADGDGVLDNLDSCGNTPVGTVIDANGCSISQRVPPCGDYFAHLEFVIRVSLVSLEYKYYQLVSWKQIGIILENAINSHVGEWGYDKSDCDLVDIDAYK